MAKRRLSGEGRLSAPDPLPALNPLGAFRLERTISEAAPSQELPRAAGPWATRSVYEPNAAHLPSALRPTLRQSNTRGPFGPAHQHHRDIAVRDELLHGRASPRSRLALQPDRPCGPPWCRPLSRLHLYHTRARAPRQPTSATTLSRRSAWPHLPTPQGRSHVSASAHVQSLPSA